jgi:hypothetical protein
MTADLVQAIFYILAEYGEPIVSTPNSLEVLLTRQCKTLPDEIQAIVAAAKHGAVEEMLRCPESNINALSESVAQQSGIPPHSARWALDTWKVALHYFELGQAPPDGSLEELRRWLDDQPKFDAGRWAVSATILIALAGAIAGMLPAVLVTEGVRHEYSQACRVRHLVERHEPTGTRMSPGEYAGWFGTLGGLGGLIGALLGWLPFGFHNASSVRILAGVIGAMWAFDGAIFGAALFGLIGTLCGALAVSAVITYVAVLLGPYAVVLFLKPLAWFVLPHFF